MKTFLLLLLCLFRICFAEPLPEGMNLEQFRTFLAADPYHYEHLPAFAARVSEEEDPQMQAHYMAACYLGFLAKGDAAAAKSAYEALKERHPESLYPERLAPDRLKKVCPDCRRLVQTRTLCTFCKGTNICGGCHGRKFIEGLSEKRSCPACHGTGKCPHCDRQGHVYKTVCPTCNNSRRVLDADRIVKFYKVMLSAEVKQIRTKHGVLFNWDRINTKAETGTD